MKKNQILRGIAMLAASAVTLGSLPVSASADTNTSEENLLASFDFNTDASDGAFIGGSAKASVSGSYTLTERTDGDSAIYFDGGANYLSVTDADGKSLLTGKDEITISYDQKADRTDTNWVFFAAPNINTQKYQQEHYLGAMVKNGQTMIERYNNSGARPANLTVENGTDWTHIDVVVEKSKTVIYVDGLPAGEVDSSYLLSDILGSKSIFQIGKANWSSGEYYKGWIDNFKIYGEALDAAGLIDTQKADEMTKQDLEALKISDTAQENIVIGTSGAHDSKLTVSIVSGNDAVSIGKNNTLIFHRTREGSQTVVFEVTAEIGTVTNTKQFTVTVPAVSAEEAAKSIVIPSVITTDLQKEVCGIHVTWECDRPDLIASDGTVTLPETGSQDVTLTAKAGEMTISGKAKVCAYGGTVLSYVSKGNDLLAYAESRRSDALFVATKDETTGQYEELNKGKAILYVKWNGSQKTNENYQMGSPSFFRYADGSLGVTASANNAENGIYVWNSADNMAFEKERYLTLSTSGVAVCDPKIVYDSSSNTYKIFWTGSDETQYVSTLDSLETGASAVTETAYVTAKEVEGELPEQAVKSETSAFVMTDEEYDLFMKKYGNLHNTGMETVTVKAEKNEQITMPETVKALYSDGTSKNLGVEWDADALAAIDTKKDGTYQIKGTVKQSTFDYPYIAERADPHVFYNEDDGYYYATGSHYPVTDPATWTADAGSCYRAIGLRRGKTLEELKDAEESLMFAPRLGDQWGSFIWAPEFHKINGTWYCLVGAHNYGKAGITDETKWGWCSYSLLIPYIGDGDDSTTLEEDMQAGGMLDARQWGEPIILEGAPSFDVSYYYDEDVKQGYYILPNTPSGARISIVKAKSEGIPQFDGAKKEIKAICFPWEYGIQEGSVSTSNPEGSDQGIVEGPYLFEYGDKVYISYSGATVDKYYCLGLMMAEKGSDLMDPASWTNVNYPVLSSYDTANGQIGGAAHVGGGHNSFALDEYGNIVLIYHARPYPDPHEGKSGAGGLFDPCRNTMVKSVNVGFDGTLVLNMTAEDELAAENQTVTATVLVGTGKDAGTQTPDNGNTKTDGEQAGADSGNHTNTENNANSGSTSTDNRNKTDTITLIKESLLKDNPGLPKGNAEEAENASFGTLKAMVKTSKATSNKIRWTKISDADGYVVYGNKCNSKKKKYAFEMISVVENGNATSYTHTRLAKNTYYKYFVQAYKITDGKVKILSTSKTIHAATKSSKIANVKKLKVNKTNVTLKKKGMKFKLKVTVKKTTGKTLQNHRKVLFESDNPKVATVSKNGVIKAKKKGKCTIYAYAQNGVYAKIKVTVKK